MRMKVCVTALLLSAVLVALTAWVDGTFLIPAMLAFVVAVFSAPLGIGSGSGSPPDGGPGSLFGGGGGGGDGGGGG